MEPEYIKISFILQSFEARMERVNISCPLISSHKNSHIFHHTSKIKIPRHRRSCENLYASSFTPLNFKCENVKNWFYFFMNFQLFFIIHWIKINDEKFFGAMIIFINDARLNGVLDESVIETTFSVSTSLFITPLTY